MKTNAETCAAPNRLRVTIVSRGVNHFAIVDICDGGKPRPGRGIGPEAAIANALNRNRVKFADDAVKDAVHDTALSGNKAELILNGETLYEISRLPGWLGGRFCRTITA